MHMKLNFKRLMAMFLSIMMVVGMLPTMVFAEDATELQSESTSVATVDGVPYADITTAINAASNNGTVTLIAAADISGVTIAEGANVTLNLNGQNLTLTSPSYGAHALTVKGELTINGDGNVEVMPFANLALGIKVDTDGKLTINGGNFSAPKGNIGSVSGTLVINGGKFTCPSNTSLFNTGNDINLTITGGEFSHAPFEERENDSRDISISGGTYGEDEVPEEWIADGYELNEDGKIVEAAPAYVAMIGEQGYEALDAAFAAAQNGDEVTILTAGTYALTGISGKNITVTGNVPCVEFTNIGAFNMGSANVTFKNVTFTYAETSTYKGLQHSGDLVYNDCTINGQVFLYGTSETFNNCVFNQTSSDAYNVWTYGAQAVEFNGCTFNSAGKSVLVYIESATAFTDLAVTDTDFNASSAVDGKAAIEIDTSLSAGANITVDAATTATGFGTGSVSGNSLWNNKKGNDVDAAEKSNDITIVVGGTTVLAPATAVTFVAKIGEVGYASLSEAIAAATAGQTITFLADITEDVTIDKNLTIDGADKNYTGKMTVGGALNVTIQNVNFVNGCIDDPDNAHGYLTVKNCSFDGGNSIGYAITVRGGDKVTIENSTAANYKTGMLYVPSSVATISVKGVKVSNVAAAFNISYSGDSTFENVEFENVTYGIHFQIHGSRTYTVKNSNLTGATNPFWFWDYADQPYKVTVVFEGNNIVPTFQEKAYTTSGVLKLAAGATLTAPEGITVITDVADSEVVYENGVYSVVAKAPAVAKIGEQGYASLAKAITAAQAGDTITFLADITEDVTVNKDLTIDGANCKYTGNIAVKGSTVDVIVKNVNFVDGSGYAITTNTIKSITVENCTVANYGYGFLYANKSTPTVVVKNVKVTNCNYGLHYVYGSNATLENVTMTDVVYGLYIQNYAAKTITLKGCDISSIAIWERSGSSGVQTFKFEGENKVGTLSASQYAKYVLAAADATLTAPEGATVTTTVENSMVKYVDGKHIVVKAVAKIDDEYYETVAEALKAAADGATVELIWSEGDAPIAMNGYVSGKTVTITGTAQVDWEKGYLFVGRTNDGTAAADATLIFNEATLTTTQGGDHGIHVSGAEKGSDTKANGTVQMIDSTINLSYLINKGAMELDNSTLTVKSGFSIGGRPASETVSGADATATISLTNGSKVVVDNHNGMGLGYEAIGIMNVDKTSSFETLKSFLVTAKGTMNLAGTAKVAGTLTNNGSIVLTDAAATLTSSECGGVTTDIAGYEVKYADGVYTVTQAELKEFYGSSVTMGNELDLKFYFSTSSAANTGYAQLVRSFGDGRADEITTVQLSDCELSGNYYMIVYKGIAAKEMCDELKVTIYDEAGNQISVERTESVRSYALRVINADSQPIEAKTMMVDMLNYGAAAQEYLEYNTSDLANSTLTDAQKALGTQTMKACTNKFTKSNDSYYGTSFVFGNELSLKMYVNKNAIGANGYVVVTYTNHLGEEKTATISKSTLSGNYYEFLVNEIVVADGRCLLTCKFYKADGTEVVTVTDSLESYVARGVSTYAWLEEVMNFSDSAYAYLHRNDK